MQTLQINSDTQMTLHEKRAWFNVAVSALTVTVFLVTAYFLGFKRSLGALVLFGLMGLNPYYYRVAYLCRRSKKVPSEIFMDERDLSIQQKAEYIRLRVFIGVFVLTCAGLWAIHRLGNVISISIDGIIVLQLAAVCIAIVVESVATLIQYAQGK
jgi:uncharacterized membrane protein